MRIAVAGGGIAGFTAALALAERGYEVDLFERRGAPEETGAGIQLSPNAMAVLDRLGVTASLAAHLVEPQSIELREAASGARLASIPLEAAARRRYGQPYCVTARTDLLGSLVAAARAEPRIALHLGAEVHAVREADQGVSFAAQGVQHRAGVLIAADGIYSRVRQEVFGPPGPRRTGKIAWRATLPIAEAPCDIGSDRTGLWLGAGAHLVHYPIRAGHFLNLVVIAADAEEAARPPPAPFGAAANRLLAAVPTWRRWPLEVVDPSSPWVAGRVALLGDAAHAMLPSAAQGGAMAIEDGWVLAAALASRPDDPVAGLRAYEAQRRRRVMRVARMASRNLAIYEMRGVGAIARNLAIRALPPGSHLAWLDWLYGWTPSSAGKP